MNPILVSRIIALWTICVGTSIGYTVSSTVSLTPYRIGPSSQFIILGITIDTMQKYIALCMYVIVNIMMRNMNFNIISPWLIQHVQNTLPLHIHSSHAYHISVCFTLYGWLDSIIYIHVIMSQMDIVLLEIVTDVMINIYITRTYLMNKDRKIEINSMA